MADYDFHPAADIFPLDEENIGSLAEDIKKNGQAVAVELYEGKILDGRRRYLACQIAQVEPIFRDVNPSDPVDYVLSLNLYRRNLTPSQRAMAAARATTLKKKYKDEADKRREATQGRPRKNGEKLVVNLPPVTDKTRDSLGKVFGVSGKTVDYATKVIAKGTPDLIKAVDEGRMAVSTAAIHAGESPDAQNAAAKTPNRTYKSVSKPLVESINDETTEEESPEGVMRGMGVICANEAINCLIRIPKNDRLRKRGFQIVMDWIKANK